MSSDEAHDDPAALRAAGLLVEAAAAYKKRGELVLAEKLYADLWDFASAANVARERGDRPAELGYSLSANDPVRAAQLAAELEHGTEIELRRAAEAFERHRRFGEAGAIRERLGELPAARELYRRGQSLLDVARLERALGRVREAGLAYEQLIAQGPEAAEAQRARLELGRLLLVLGRPEEATRHLQAARRAIEDPAVLEELIVALDRLGYDAAVDEIHAELSALQPTTPTRASLIERHRTTPAGGPLRLAGRYEVELLLGAGASGRVFLARDTLKGGQVAVKVLAAPFERRAQESWARFFAEARLVGSLRHPNVVEVREVDEAHGLLVMEYVASGTLFDRLYTGKRAAVAEHADPLPAGLVRRMLLDVLDALGAVHARGIVHRDLKPANLFFTPTGEVKLGDFGAAHLFSEEATQTAGFVGTLAYMAPEQISGGAVDFAADLYALGAITYHALTGRPPFPGPDFVAQHLGDPPPRPRSVIPSLDVAWDELVARMLAKEPCTRGISDESVRRAVERIRIGDELPTAHEVIELAPAAERQARYVAVSPIGKRLALGTDTALGRSIVIEHFPRAYLESSGGAAHLAWVRAFAKDSGPHVQRLFALAPRDDGGFDAIFEAAAGETTSLVDGDVAVILRSLAALHAQAIAHGSIPTSIARGPFGPQLLVAGRTPSPDATETSDREALSAASR